MVRQVQVVAILMIVNGALVSLMGLYLALFVPATQLFVWSQARSQPASRSGDTTFLLVMSVLYFLMGLLVLTAAGLNIIAGIRSLRFRGRVLALVALFSNLAPMLTCWCMPMCLGLMIYGLIVFFNSDVAFVFAEVAAGEPPQRFKYGIPRADDDYDEDEDDEGPLPPRDEPAPRRPGENVQLAPDEFYRPPASEE